MNTEHLALERHLKKSTITSNLVSVAIALLTALSVGYGFYYNTNSTLDSHTMQIKEVKTDVESLKDAVNNSAIFQGATGEQIKAVEVQVNDVKASQIRIEEKLDRLILKSTK
jgi:septal ring factor EnvC (AmiA/AmiB activator)